MEQVHQRSVRASGTHRGSGRRSLVVMAFGALVLLAACGQGASTIAVPTTPSTSAAVSTLEPTTSSTSLAPASTVATPTTVACRAVGAGDGNLAGQPSTCGTLSLVSARPDKDELIAGLWPRACGPTRAARPWAPIGKGAGSAPITNRSTSIVYDPEHPGTFWESGIYGTATASTRRPTAAARRSERSVRCPAPTA